MEYTQCQYATAGLEQLHSVDTRCKLVGRVEVCDGIIENCTLTQEEFNKGVGKYAKLLRVRKTRGHRHA